LKGNLEAEYSIPAYVSPLARDLLQRMLQVNPGDRIKIAEIKNHPWLRKYVPIYTKLSTLFSSDHED
jgi:serine/threonine protein kinase